MASDRPPSYGAFASTSSSTPRTAVPEIRSAIPPDELTQLLLQRTENWTSSAAIQETELSAPPVGADLPQEPPTSFRRSWLLSLDLLRGLLLCLQAFDTACLLLAESPKDRPPQAIPGTGRSVWSALGHEALRTYHWRALTYPAAPGLFFLLGAGPVFFLNAQARLGWSTGQQLWHFLLRALCLLLISEVIAVLLPWHNGSPVLYGLLPHWVLGFAYIVAGLVLIIAFHIERFAARSYMRALIRHRRIRRRIGEVLWKSNSQDAVPTVDSLQRPQASEDGVQDAAAPEPKTLVWAAFSVDVMLLAMAAGGLAGNLILAKSLRKDALEGIVRERNWLFWLFIAPNSSSVTRLSPLMSAYTPITWLAPTLGGVVYGRWLSRRARTKTVIQIVNALFAVVLFAGFCVMRAIPILNVAEGIPSLTHQPTPLDPHNKPALFATLKYPPEPTHILLYSAIFFILLNLVSLIPAHIGERSPLLVYGTSPFAFLFFSVVYFKVLSPYFLHMFDIWPRLALIWVLPIYIAGLLLLHYGCRIYGAFKRTKPVTSVWRFL